MSGFVSPTIQHHRVDRRMAGRLPSSWPRLLVFGGCSKADTLTTDLFGGMFCIWVWWCTFQAFIDRCTVCVEPYFVCERLGYEFHGYHHNCLTKKGSWVRACWWAWFGADAEWPGITSLDGCSPSRNVRMAHYRLMSMLMGFKTIVGCIAAVGAISTFPSEEIESKVHSCEKIYPTTVNCN